MAPLYHYYIHGYIKCIFIFVDLDFKVYFIDTSKDYGSTILFLPLLCIGVYQKYFLHI